MQNEIESEVFTNFEFSVLKSIFDLNWNLLEVDEQYKINFSQLEILSLDFMCMKAKTKQQIEILAENLYYLLTSDL